MRPCPKLEQIPEYRIWQLPQSWDLNLVLSAREPILKGLNRLCRRVTGHVKTVVMKGIWAASRHSSSVSSGDGWRHISCKTFAAKNVDRYLLFQSCIWRWTCFTTTLGHRDCNSAAERHISDFRCMPQHTIHTRSQISTARFLHIHRMHICHKIWKKASILATEMGDSRIQTSSGHLTRQCKICGGTLTNTRSTQSLQSGLAVFRNVARRHTFQFLLEATEWVLKDLPKNRWNM